jgi:hypothetical protein
MFLLGVLTILAVLVFSYVGNSNSKNIEKVEHAVLIVGAAMILYAVIRIPIMFFGMCFIKSICLQMLLIKGHETLSAT